MTPGYATLVAVRKLLDKPERWTQQCWARDKDGFAVSEVYHRMAVCWCLGGAVYKVGKGITERVAAREFIKKAIRTTRIAKWNDTKGRRHETVLAALDRAIELAKKESDHA